MILDTSAIIAAVRYEPQGEAVTRAIADAAVIRISASALVELTAVVSGQREVAAHHLMKAQLEEWGVETIPFDERQAAVAQQAYRDYGRGSGHPAKLNMGDCFSYALAATMREPLLYVGDDFSHTDIRSVL